MSKAIAASIVPFFDRLCGLASASQDGRMLDAGGLQRSLELDLARLFNTRNGLTVEEFLSCEPSVLHYGLPDSLSLSPQSQVDLDIWASVLQRCVEMFEPRLSHVRIEVKADRTRPDAARATLAAAVMLGRQLCRVSFDVALNSQAVQVEAAA
ncbi:type VI secretion system baseplate subunit TssE [Noviherbaspirillum galbum]|uniref:Type VI secretion system baseplate subunit TssE n=1 Tax=Noviherbaspirillum galbum TaxID=2709383 RepID=A0A6B3SVM1_9BURK|nr:type VI secretion system baseplate subunit TssE [Noviherbaspirillum galbum]NEX64797.1 type VI secretion system baseplate subunit TssE [Noviherbaspirillum galbum]